MTNNSRHAMTTRPWTPAALLALLVLSGLVALARLHTYHEFPSRDEATYSIIAQGLVKGHGLYSSMWDNKPPAIHWTYAAVQWLTGPGPLSLYLLRIAGAILCVLGTYAAASARASWKGAGLCAAAAMAIVSGDLHLQANEAQTEVYINACLVWAFALLLKLRPQAGRWHVPLAVGLLIGAASLYKTVVVAQAIALAAGYVACHVLTPRRRRALAQAATIAAGAALPWLLTAAGFAATGAFRDFHRAVFTYNAHYATLSGGNLLSNVLRGLRPDVLAPMFTLALWPMAAFALAGLALSLTRSPSRPAILLGCYLLSTQPAVAMAGQYAPHYYIMWMPPLAIAAAWAIGAIAARIRNAPRAAPAVLAATLLLLLAIIQYPSYKLPADEWFIIKYGDEAMLDRETAELIGQLLAPGETFYHWGSAVGLYYATRKFPPSGLFFLTPLLPGPLMPELPRRAVADLERARPELIVLDARDVPVMRGHPVTDWIAKHYEYFGRIPSNARFGIYCRRGGRLHRQLSANCPSFVMHGLPTPPQVVTGKPGAARPQPTGVRK